MGQPHQPKCLGHPKLGKYIYKSAFFTALKTGVGVTRGGCIFAEGVDGSPALTWTAVLGWGGGETMVAFGAIISHMKTTGEKYCRLCMQERINLFYAFGRKISQYDNLINSRTKLYGACSSLKM